MELIYYSAPHRERRNTNDGYAAITTIGIVRHECGCSLSRKDQGHSLRREDQGRCRSCLERGQSLSHENEGGRHQVP